MSGIMSMLLGAVSSVAVAVDEFFNRVTLLLPGNGTNGAQNNTFLDSSTNNFTITRNGNTTQGTFSPFSQTGWSNFFNASATYISTASATPLVLSGGSWTIEAWAFCTGGSGYRTVLSKRTGATAEYEMGIDPSGYFYYYTSTVYADTTTVPLNQWVHLAVTYDGTNLRMFQNGVLTRTVASVSAGSGAGNLAISIEAGTGGQAFPGYISNVRITKGGALYTSGFTPSSSPLTTTVSSGTVSFLSCQSNRFVDNSSNAYTLTITGTPSVQAFSPFAPTAAYSAATVGGSGYFDGSGDYLSNASNTIVPSTGDFTLQLWVYPTQVTVLQYLISTTSTNTGNKFHVYINASAYVGVQTGSSYRDSSTTKVVANAWSHVAITRTGSTYNIYVNGVLQTISGTGTMATTLDVTPTQIGSRDAGTSPITGYISGLRLTNVVETISVPTAPPTNSVSGGTVQLLLNFTNAGITDATAKNVLETAGNAQISTTQSKFGGSSMYFDGNGDFLILNYPSVTSTAPIHAFGTGDFTIEAWVYSTVAMSGSLVFLFDFRPASTNGAYPALYFDNTGTIYYTNSGAQITGSVLSANTWTHIAVCRSGTSTRLFINGTQSGSTYTDSTNYISYAQRPVIASSGFGLGTSMFTGYIDDFRISRVARYTSNFTAPTSAFALQ